MGGGILMEGREGEYILTKNMFDSKEGREEILNKRNARVTPNNTLF